MAKNDNNNKLLAVLPYREKVLFPHMVATFDVGRSMSLQAIRYASGDGRYIFITLQKNKSIEDITPDNLYDVGVVASLQSTESLPAGGGIRLTVKVLYRAVAKTLFASDGCYLATTSEIVCERQDAALEEAHFRAAKKKLRDAVASDSGYPREKLALIDSKTNPDEFIDMVAFDLHTTEETKQRILQEANLVKRFELLEACLDVEVEIGKMEKRISATVRQNMDKNQKEYLLREKIRAIHTELGDDVNELDELREKVKSKGCPQEVEAKAMQELSRMDKMQSSSPDYTVLRGYIDWIIDLPWREETKDTEKISDCEAVLEADHYGLEKIKKRVLEYLSVLKLTGTMKAPILCFVGPPGVGKTSIATSIAKALGRKFVRMSLGGVKDEAEIRGHRKTYVGAIPGRILYGMKQAGSVNPVFLLDEIDKVSSDMRGDPASALLEVLDPEQNATFRDRYLELPYDLSKVMFITTANSLDTIPSPLLDRMEVIQLSGYAPSEKLEIADRYLVPKCKKANGIPEEKLLFARDGLAAIADYYTMEAGVRGLERKIGGVCRKVAVRLADNPDLDTVTVTAENVEDYLGAKELTRDEKSECPEVGVATGLAWTSVGGTTLSIEVSVMKGKGEILLTGKLGDVMKESARIALSYIRANAASYGIPAEKFTESDVHIHVPEGATPKDGPSAGITLTLAILSAFTQRKVRNDVAMTGEVTLRGKVLPIGGLKEKALAAYRIGITTILIPEKNKKDLEEIPADVREKLTFIPVKEVTEVFEAALLP